MYKEEIEKIIVPIIARNDCYLWGTEILRGKKRTTLRIYIDSKNGLSKDLTVYENLKTWSEMRLSLIHI